VEELSRYFPQEDIQQVPEKGLNITSHQENTNQKHNEISFHTCSNGYYQKNKRLMPAGYEKKKREPLCSVGRNVN